MKETTSASQRRKEDSLNVPRRLTEQEIESLRQDSRDCHEMAKILLKDEKPL